MNQEIKSRYSQIRNNGIACEYLDENCTCKIASSLSHISTLVNDTRACSVCIKQKNPMAPNRVTACLARYQLKHDKPENWQKTHDRLANYLIVTNEEFQNILGKITDCGNYLKSVFGTIVEINQLNSCNCNYWASTININGVEKFIELYIEQMVESMQKTLSENFKIGGSTWKYKLLVRLNRAFPKFTKWAIAKITIILLRRCANEEKNQISI